MVIHWTFEPQASRIMRDLPASLVDYAMCADSELLAATANSLWREHPRLRAEWAQLLERFPRRTQVLLTSADGVCESGTEFVFWIRMRRLHPRMRRQVWIPGVGRVDFLIGERLVIEIDGWDSHGDREQFEADRNRDALLGALGYRVHRYSHKQVFERWGSVEAAIYAAIARADHL